MCIANKIPVDKGSVTDEQETDKLLRCNIGQPPDAGSSYTDDSLTVNQDTTFAIFFRLKYQINFKKRSNRDMLLIQYYYMDNAAVIADCNLLLFVLCHGIIYYRSFYTPCWHSG